MDIERLISRIASEDDPSTSLLVNLSDLSFLDVEKLLTLWRGIRVERRRRIISKLVELAEEDFRLNFDAIFRMCLEDDDPFVRERAIDGLYECEDPSLIEPLIRLLKEDVFKEVRASAALALGKFALLAELRKIREYYKPQIFSALLSVIEDPEEVIEVKRRAVEAISPFSHPRVEEIIKEAYESPEPSMRLSSIYAMGRNCNPRWLPILIKELSNPEPEFRYEAANACGEIGEEEAVPYLIPLLRDEDIEVRRATIQALGKIGGSMAKRALKKLLNTKDETLRELVEEALEEIEGFEGL